MIRLTNAILALLCIAVGFAIGAWIGVAQRIRAGAGVDATVASGRAERLLKAQAGSLRMASSQEDLVTKVISASLELNPLRCAYELRTLLAPLDSAQLGSLFTRVVQIRGGDERSVLIDAIVSRWALVDRQALDAAVAPYLQSFRAAPGKPWNSVESEVLRAWTALDPKRILAEAIASPTAASRGLASMAMSHLAGDDAEKQLKLLSSMAAGRLRDELTSSALQRMAAVDPVGAEAYLCLIADPRSRARTHAELFEKLARRDPAAALARIVKMGPTLHVNIAGIGLVTSAFRHSAVRDPEQALAIASSFPEALRSTALGAALVGWAGTEPLAALEWAAAHGVDVTEAKAIMELSEDGASWIPLLSTASSTEGAKTLQWILAQPATSARDEMLESQLWGTFSTRALDAYAAMTPAAQIAQAPELVQRMFRDSPEKAVAWVEAVPPGAQRVKATRALVYAQAEANPGEVESLPDAWTPGPDRNAALSAVALHLIKSDPNAAIANAAKITDPLARENAMIQLGQMWLARDAASARKWITGSAPIAAEVKQVLLRPADER